MTAFVSRISCYGALWAAMLLATYGFNTYFIEHHRPSLAGTMILIAGDSHPGTSINPDVMIGSRSVTRGAEPYIQTYHKLNALLRRPHDVQTVLLGFGHHNFAPITDLRYADPIASRSAFGAMYPIMERRDFEPLDVNEDAYRISLLRWLLLVPRIDHHRRYMGGFMNMPAGSYRGHVEARGDLEMIAERIFYVDGQPGAVSSVATTYLAGIMDLLEELRVDLVLVDAPLHPEFLANVPEPFVDHYEGLAAMARGRGVLVIDGGGYPLPESGFSDPFHLNYEGSIVFTNLLIRDLGLDGDG